MQQFFGGLASVGGQGVGPQNTARLGQVLPVCTPTPTTTDTPTNTPTDTPTTGPTDTATSTIDPSATATLGGVTEVPGSETPVVQLPDTGSGSNSSNSFALIALLLLAASGVVWAIGRSPRKT
jgi:LPXTG-motif cell wall-anchored protein